MTDTLRISTERLRLRPISPEDFPYWRDFFATEHSHFVDGPLAEDEAWNRVAGLIGHWAMAGFGYWSVETAEGVYLGRTGLDQPSGWAEPELGWQIFDGFEGKGLAQEAARAARDHAARHFRLDGVISYIRAENTRSRALAERLGATVEREGELIGIPMLVYRHPTLAQLETEAT